VHHGQVQALTEGAGEGGFAATGIAQNYNPLHEDFLSRKKPAIVQVLEGQLKADRWVIQGETVAANKPSVNTRFFA
jgi:hypothetical protein